MGWTGRLGHLPFRVPLPLLTSSPRAHQGGSPANSNALCISHAAGKALRPSSSRLPLLAEGPALTPRPHSPPSLPFTHTAHYHEKHENRTVRRKGSELLPNCPRQFLQVPLPTGWRCPGPCLLACGEAWSQLLAFSPLSNSLGAHTQSQPPPAFLALPLPAQTGLQAEPAVPLRALPPSRSLTLRARPLPTGSTAWWCQAESNWLSLFRAPNGETGSPWGGGSLPCHSLLGSQTSPGFILQASPHRFWRQRHLPSRPNDQLAYLQPQKVL